MLFIVVTKNKRAKNFCYYNKYSRTTRYVLKHEVHLSLRFSTFSSYTDKKDE